MTVFEKMVVTILLSIAGGFAYAGYSASNFGWWFLSGSTVALTYALVRGHIGALEAPTRRAPGCGPLYKTNPMLNPSNPASPISPFYPGR